LKAKIRERIGKNLEWEKIKGRGFKGVYRKIR
jgi:hypothetical protein